MMKEAATSAGWHPLLADPTAKRPSKPRPFGRTMVIDKGLGLSAYTDLLDTAAAHIDIIKLGFGTAALYPEEILKRKIRMALERSLSIMPGGTFLEIAVVYGLTGAFFDMAVKLGFNAVEISDGTIELSREQRTELIRTAIGRGLTVYTEYGKKCWGSRVHAEALAETALQDLGEGAELVTVEARESGAGVGIFDENGECRDEEIGLVIKLLPSPHLLLWEAPQKDQQTRLIQLLGPEVNLGNVAPQDVMALEALRRGLRSDTMPTDQLRLDKED